MGYFNLHTHHFTNDPEILEIVNQYPAEFDAAIPNYSIGIHPWYIVEDRATSDLELIESKMQSRSCRAIGECGLDKRIQIEMPLQMDVFEAQLALAQKYRKPVIIHCVAAFSELIRVKNKMKISVPMIVHGFSKNAETAKQLLDNGFYLSFGKYLLRNPELELVFKSVPDNRFFLETDTVEESISEVYALAAKYKNISVDELKGQIKTSFVNVFNAE